MSEPRYRVWRVEAKGYTMRISLKPAKTKAEMIELFHIKADEKLIPVLDNRMKDGGKFLP